MGKECSQMCSTDRQAALIDIQHSQMQYPYHGAFTDAE